MGDALDAADAGRFEDMKETLGLDAVVLTGRKGAAAGNEEVADSSDVVLADDIDQVVGTVEVDGLDEDALTELRRQEGRQAARAVTGEHDAVALLERGAGSVQADESESAGD